MLITYNIRNTSRMTNIAFPIKLLISSISFSSSVLIICSYFTIFNFACQYLYGGFPVKARLCVTCPHSSAYIFFKFILDKNTLLRYNDREV